ncbi:MAG: hypothetical protein N2167_11760, partial [Flavobacteriales bacterium]|nr:hypothetical protein [Flavobacteriales bacterium]
MNVNFAEKEMKAKILIPPGSTISKVYLFATQDGVPNFFVPPRNVFINDSLFQHYEFSRFTKPFISYSGISVVFDESYINVLDITNRFSYSNDSLHVFLETINHDPYKGFMASFTIVIIYENPALPKMGYTIVLNEQNVDHYLTYNVQFPHPIQNDKPVGFGIWGWHMCGSFQGDNSDIYVNNIHIGDVGGEEPNVQMWCT